MDNNIRSPLPRGYQLDGYRLEREIAEGGFGITYLAQQLAFERRVAIKEYLPWGVAVRGADGTTVEPRSKADAADFDHGLTRFREEGKTLVNFEHPNIVAAYDFREINNTAYLVMRYVEGNSLHEMLSKHGVISERRLKEILFPLLEGVEQIHAAGFLHRDIKPSNIIIQSDCTPVLVDFGAARNVRGRNGDSPTSIVSSGYAPIEQYSGRRQQGPWTDIYALGATLYHAITGFPPADAVGRMDSDTIIPAVKAGAGHYNEAFLAAIDKALARNAADRPQSIAEFRALFNAPVAVLVPAHARPTLNRTLVVPTAAPSLRQQIVRTAPARSNLRRRDGGLATKVSPELRIVSPHSGHRSGTYQPLLRFALFNTAAFALTAAAFMQGWIEAALKADSTGLTVVIGVAFLGGLVLSGLKVWTITRELNCIRNHDPCRRSWAARYLRAIAGRGAGSRAILASAMRASVSSGIVVVRHIASSLVLLGLIGTVLGFIIALAGVDPNTVQSPSAIGPMVGHLIEGMSVALYTTLVGAILNLWLIVNFHSLVGDATRFVTELVALGELNEQTRPS